MKAKLSILFLVISMAFVSCEADETTNESSPIMTIEDFPVIDCSTSTQPLSVILTAKTLGLPYVWWNNAVLDQTWYCKIDYDKATISQGEKEVLESKMKCSTTHGSYTNLIDGNVELIIASRNISRDEKNYADEKGVSLIEHPIGRDAFIFIVNNNNPVNNLTISQIQDIYTGKTRNWKDVGGNDATISPYIRNANSGSQEKMETLVMKGLTMIDWPEMITHGMAGPFFSLRYDKNGIAYTPYFYYSIMARGEQAWAKSICVNGIEPNKSTISNNTYPYVSEIYAAVRSDIDKTSTAYKLFEYLTTTSGQDIVKESGYVPVSTSTDIKKVTSQSSSSAFYTDLSGRKINGSPKGLVIKTETIKGKVVSEKIIVK